MILGIIQVISGLSVNILWSRFDATNKNGKSQRTFWIIWGSLMMFLGGANIERFLGR
jgi:hypothetical protein